MPHKSLRLLQTMRLTAFALLLAAAPTATLASDCGDDAAGFGAWLQRFKARAAAQGIAPAAISSGLAGVSYDANVIRLDRSQRSFKLSFEEFYARRVGAGLIRRGQNLMRTHRATLDRVEQRFGVPAAVLIAIWGLETNYGSDGGGGKSIVRSLATLAYDCRRSEMFRDELMDALRIVDRGDLSPDEMIGSWAGELGQTQFLPTSYVKFAVDFDGNGRRDLIRSVPDVLASTANYLRGYGWQRGQPWSEGTHNFAVLKAWNKADVYQKTIALFATRLAERRTSSSEAR